MDQNYKNMFLFLTLIVSNLFVRNSLASDLWIIFRVLLQVRLVAVEFNKVLNTANESKLTTAVLEQQKSKNLSKLMITYLY